jgi:NADH dehydrogenase
MADRTKARGEVAVRAAFPAVTLVRPSLLYGPGDHFFPRLAALAKVSPVLPIIGGGRTRFQPLHIDDAIRTLLALLERPETAGATLALVGPETFTLRALQPLLLLTPITCTTKTSKTTWRSGTWPDRPGAWDRSWTG